MLIQCYAIHAVEYGVSGFFSQRMLAIRIYLSVYPSISLKPSSFSSRKDDFHLPHSLLGKM